MSLASYLTLSYTYILDLLGGLKTQMHANHEAQCVCAQSLVTVTISLFSTMISSPLYNTWHVFAQSMFGE